MISQGSACSSLQYNIALLQPDQWPNLKCFPCLLHTGLHTQVKSP